MSTPNFGGPTNSPKQGPNGEGVNARAYEMRCWGTPLSPDHSERHVLFSIAYGIL